MKKTAIKPTTVARKSGRRQIGPRAVAIVVGMHHTQKEPWAGGQWTKHLTQRAKRARSCRLLTSLVFVLQGRGERLLSFISYVDCLLSESVVRG